jgi:hypothetical protein
MDSPSTNAHNDSKDLPSEETLQNTFTNLRILSKIEIGDKLYFYNDQFVIDKWTYLQPITRWYYAESRSTSLQHLQDFIQKVFTLVDVIYANENGSLEKNYYVELSRPSVFKEENASILVTFINDLKNATVGISNLKQTYKNDITIISALDILIEHIHVRIKKINAILSIRKD